MKGKVFLFVISLCWAAFGTYGLVTQKFSLAELLTHLLKDPTDGWSYIAAFFAPAGLFSVLMGREYIQRRCDYDVEEMFFSHARIEIRANKASSTLRVKAGNFEYEGSPSKLVFSYQVKTKLVVYIPTFTGRTSSGEYVTGTGGPARSYEEKTGNTVVSIRRTDDGTVTKLTLKNTVAEKMERVTEGMAIWKKEIGLQEYKQHQAENDLAEQRRREGILAKARENYRTLMAEWGWPGESEVFVDWNYNHTTGDIREMLVGFSDGRGAAIYEDGRKTWQGSWKNAEVAKSAHKLSIKVDDPEFRKERLTERRFDIVLMHETTRNVWFDRIRILSTSEIA